MLTWTERRRVWTAVGLRGTYTVRWHDGAHWLTAVGHDTIPLWGIPAGGQPFATRDGAQMYAHQLDHPKAVEAEISGAG